MGEPVVFDAAIEGLFVRGLGPKVTPGLKSALREAGIDLDQLKAQYPRAVWVKALDLTAREVFPQLPADQAFRKLGDVAVSGIGNTLIGKAIVSMARMLGPKRAMYRLNQAFRSLNNFLTVEVAELAPNHFKLTLSEAYDRPTYLQGAIEAAVRLSHNHPFDVRVLPADGPGVCLEVKWDQPPAGSPASPPRR